MPEINVLVVFASPLGEPRLRVDKEDQVIRTSIKYGRYRENIKVERLHAARILDLTRILLDQEFEVVHFSGHGLGKGLLLEDDQGMAKVVPAKHLAELFEEYKRSVKCVILNACYSFAQGKLIAKHVPYTIVVKGTADDNAAIEFSRGFYDAIAAGKSYDFAYREGRRAVKLNLPDAKFDSRLLKQSDVYDFDIGPVFDVEKQATRVLEELARNGGGNVDDLKKKLGLSDADFEKADGFASVRRYVNGIGKLRYITEDGRRFISSRGAAS